MIKCTKCKGSGNQEERKTLVGGGLIGEAGKVYYANIRVACVECKGRGYYQEDEK